ncbi:molybdopterin-dependent oxidoreductase [Yinghuangia aomiensis]|uniref:Molybdopterin-dependent oxidoreductase n=1 Tax=Yinghuangia aomiensis TaxID=676205 RepID=A0ABP9I4S5_9ACTN
MTAAPLTGQRLNRVTDPMILAGQARYVDDIALTGMLHAAILRSPVAHARIMSFDAADALALDGVVAVLGPDDIARMTEPQPCTWLVPGQRITNVPLADTVVRHIGQPVGIVVAESRALAEDGADLVLVDYDGLPAVAAPEAALAADAPLLYPDLGGNTVAEAVFGTPPEDLERAFATAAHIVERRLEVPRVAPSPMETRGVVADFAPGTGELTVWTSNQGPHMTQQHLAHILRLRIDRIRVVQPHLGGSFGAKDHLYQDEALACLAAVHLRRPVKWIEDRTEHFTATKHGRGGVYHARLALDEDAAFTALDVRITADLGAFPSTVGTGPFQVTAMTSPGPYRYTAAGATLTGVVTNTTPTAAYRGYGQNESAWIRERLIDEAARELGIEAVELRRRNLIPASDMPYATPMHMLYDTGDYPELLHRAERLAAGARRERTGRVRRGIGIAANTEFTGLGPSGILQMLLADYNGWEQARVRIEPDGGATVFTGIADVGQGITTALTQLAADALGMPADAIVVKSGDTATSPMSLLTAAASRGLTVGGTPVIRACRKMRERLVRIAAARFDAAPGDVAFDGVSFRVGDASVALAELARDTWLGWNLPKGELPVLEETDVYDPANVTFAGSVHVAQVAVDLDTATARVEAYWVVHDSGVVVNPKIADGQIIGGIAQGLGGALLERITYAPDGTPLTTTFLDYLLPVSEDMPDIVIEHMHTPSSVTPEGMKGLGEGGTIPSTAAIGNAVADAVPEIAGHLLAAPLAPTVLHGLLAEAHLAR